MNLIDQKPNNKISARKLFNIDSDIEVPCFADKSEYVPQIDEDYCFHKDTTMAILAGLIHNRRVLIQGYHGTGKSTHVEQIAARLNWPCLRVNFDGNISRIDLIGRDAIIIREGMQVTEFREGVIPWSLRRPVMLVLDEYDAARPDVMFVLQRLLESGGKFTLVDKNEVITPHEYFRIFATSNTIGLGDTTGIYHGVQPINQGQMDRWNIVVNLNYLKPEEELKILLSKSKSHNQQSEVATKMIQLANLTREAFMIGDLSTVMSPRTVISWAENQHIFADLQTSFRLSFLNKCDESERHIIAELYQRCFGDELKLVG